MAQGISSPELVTKLAENGMLGFLGLAGLTPERQQQMLDQVHASLQGRNLPWGVNLIHTPADLGLEEALVQRCFTMKIHCIEASAFLALTPSVVLFTCKGLQQNAQGLTQRQNHLIAKVSRPEVAKAFLSPPPKRILDRLVKEGKLSADEAELGRHLPIAEDITLESDSGGHTDNRPLLPLFATVRILRNELTQKYNYTTIPRLGAAGGISTPDAIAAAFALGAAYVCVGSVHQSCVEAGQGVTAKKLLAQVGLADVAMTASAALFEMGGRVQVLKRGSMMPQRGNFLYDLYRRHQSIEKISQADRNTLEKDIFRSSLTSVWQETETYLQKRSPVILKKAQADPRVRMAMIFCWYLGQSSQWAINDIEDRRLDYQIWCGPGMGAFNAWAKGSFLENPANRTVQEVSRNLMEIAAAFRAGDQDMRPSPLNTVP